MDSHANPETVHAPLYLADWKPREGWASVIAPAAAALDADPQDVTAWAQVAMMLGDSGAAPLGLLVALHAHRFAPDDRAVKGHLGLFLLDLGLSAGTPERVAPVRPAPALATWVERQLTPFGGDLARAAHWALALAAVRTGVSPGPDPAL